MGDSAAPHGIGWVTCDCISLVAQGGLEHPRGRHSQCMAVNAGCFLRHTLHFFPCGLSSCGALLSMLLLPEGNPDFLTW